LVRAAQNELKLVGRHTDGIEDSRYAELVVLGPVVDKFDGRLEVVEEPVAENSEHTRSERKGTGPRLHIGKENDDIAPSCEQLTDFQGWDKVTAVRATCDEVSSTHPQLKI